MSDGKSWDKTTGTYVLDVNKSGLIKQTQKKYKKKWYSQEQKRSKRGWKEAGDIQKIITIIWKIQQGRRGCCFCFVEPQTTGTCTSIYRDASVKPKVGILYDEEEEAEEE